MNEIEELGLLAGDIGLTSTEAWISRVIRFFESWQTKEATKSHAFIVINQRACIEALSTVKISLLRKYDKPEQVVDIYRIPLSEEDRNKMFFGATGRINKCYGWLKIPLFAFDAILTKVTGLFGRKNPIFFFTKYFGITHFMVCSHLVVWAIHKFTNFRFQDETGSQVSWRTVSPDRLEDLLKLPINNAKRIYCKEKANEIKSLDDIHVNE